MRAYVRECRMPIYDEFLSQIRQLLHTVIMNSGEDMPPYTHIPHVDLHVYERIHQVCKLVVSKKLLSKNFDLMVCYLECPSCAGKS